ncbi:drug/metabolite transporter (DMT)-like permease [Bradyrhizobium yuanmingense]|uniref:DMT family transporter n=1 Tax=Bradyrhizobium yuanmingense TaxID=108015 RepID=UPI0035115338
MSAPQAIPSAGRPLSAGAIALMLMLCLTWGFNQIAVKLVLPDIPPMLQATIRSMGALPVLFLIGTFRGVKFFERDGTWKPGLIAGLMFGIEFVLIFQGLHFTSASRAVVFLYTAPFFVALAIGVPQPNVDSQVLLGDLMIVGGAALWAATTLVAKGTRLRFAAPEKALGYQVATSIPILGLAAWLFGESITHTPSPLSLGLMAFQAIWVVGTTFTLWFALVKAYSASKLSAFTFITPLFGVVGSYFIMHDTLSLTFGAAAVLVIAGLFLVNRPSPSVAAPRDALLNVTKT